ncbi:type II toxin-antitoxin system RelE family toxin [Desertivirga arenae]|uniref:type II toxin-antitoxin system RelE family toxin n=1 Tax=Desertivirga arenae TaxID=2810309 RepID=UPI001A9577C1|nr:hypothetical protein [Pedobacter sp. SYSU D00823]
MEIQITKNFIKQAGKLPVAVQKDVADIIKDITEANSLDNIKGVKRLKAKGVFYRIRLGDYRIGIESLEGNVISFRIVGHRRLVYDTFPPSK